MFWRSLGSFGFVGGRSIRVVVFVLFHSGTTLESSGSFGVDGFIRERPCGRWVHSGGSLRSFGFVVFIRAHPWGRPGSFGSFGRALGVLWCIWARFGDHWFHSSSLDSFGHTRRVSLSSLWSVSFGRALWVVGFFLVRWVNSGAPT